MERTGSPRGPVGIVITEDDEGYWVTKGKIGQLCHFHHGAMNTAHRLFMEKGGEGKAVIIDLTNPKGRNNA
jgi:hypothetical protein